ncbi:MAG: AAA family ATPase [Cyanobacteriota bacterium]|nr:AAA family ATPase [Cyanobacteriota bacterium]
MNISQQRLHQLEIKKLKNIEDLCISFEDKNITGILGPNGCGKSTILHALACCFQPPDESGENYKFSNFFLPNPDALWQGSDLKIIYSYRQESEEYKKLEKHYAKAKDRWKPIYARRPIRSVHYFGIDSCVPLIEAEKRNVKIHYSTIKVSENIFKEILKQASLCLNRKYTAYNMHDSGKGKKFIGVETNGIKYSALSMSAGEQKIFSLLEKVFQAQKYSLILIDEFDLLLHDLAMKNLLKVLDKRAKNYNLQIIFTTHRESILELSDLINVRHIWGTADKTFCFDRTKPDAINRLTGNRPKLIEVFVEDDLAAAIVERIAYQLNILKYVSIQRFGAAINCFTMLAALLLRGECFENTIFVLDGDVYNTEKEQKKYLKKVLTGDDKNAKSLRNSGLEKIKCFNLTENTEPEKYIHSIIINLDESDDEDGNEIIEVAKEIRAVENSHDYVDEIINQIGWDRKTGLSNIIRLVSSTPEWNNFVRDVKEWLSSKLNLVKEQ